MKTFLLFILMLYVHAASASVIMVGTRVIVPSAAKEKTVQFKNPDPQPFIVEIKLSDEHDHSSQVPFVAVPPVFRIEPHQGQSVRLIPTSAEQLLPRDRESVFYMNFTQIPALKRSARNDNQLIIAVKSRVKVFYRPETLTGQQSEAFKSLRFSLNNGKVKVENPTGFYISISRALFVSHTHSVTLTDAVMLAPLSSMEWSPAERVASLRDGKIRITQVNDYGAYVENTKNP